MLNFIDVHTHLNDSKLKDNLDEVRRKYLSNGVNFVVDSGCSYQSTKMCLDNAEKYSEVYFTAGIHPDTANNGFNEKEFLLIKEYATHKKCIAIGEVGLDYYYDGYNKENQKEIFVKFLTLANELNLPVVIHSRSATKDTLDILKGNKNLLSNGFLMHCYSDSYEIAKELLKLGARFSFGGSLTFKNSKRGEVLSKLPLDSLMFETDAPYMSPEPLRGRINESANVIYVYEFVAQLLKMPIEDLALKIENNFKSLFKKVCSQTR